MAQKACNGVGRFQKCRDCKEVKSIEEFSIDKSRKSGRRYECKDCHSRQRRMRDKNSIRSANLRKNFGLTLDDYQLMYNKQGGVCAICGKSESSTLPKYGTLRMLAVDHDHDTGKVRGLLCSSCNRAIGFFQDDIDLLTNAIKYLKENI